LACALLAALTGVAIQGLFLLRAATYAAEALPGEVPATRAALVGEIDATRLQIEDQVEAARKETLALVDRQSTAIQSNALSAIAGESEIANGQITAALTIADRRMGDTLTRVDAALGTVEALRKDAKPSLDNSAALVKDLQDSLDDNYYDLKATIESSTVAVTGIARAAEAVGDAMPSMTASADSVGKSAAKEADALTKPQTFWQGVKSWLLLVGRCAGFLL
jgi:hypothetical protein